jgi:predicted transcriptional regulator
LSDSKRGQIVGAHLAQTSVTKTATLLGVSKATVSKVMSGCKENISKEEQWAKINTDRKRRIVLGSHTTAAAQVTGQQN